MSDLPPPPELDFSSQVATMGAPESPPCENKEDDEMAQLSPMITGQLPVTEEPEYVHPLVSDVENVAPSEDDFPSTPVLPAPARRPIDKRALDPYNTMGLENTWPGLDGVPYRGAKFDLKQDDERQPKMIHEANVEKLELSNPDDMERYRDILQTIANGMAKLGVEDRVYDPDVKNWRILIRWWSLHVTVKK